MVLFFIYSYEYRWRDFDTRFRQLSTAVRLDERLDFYLSVRFYNFALNGFKFNSTLRFWGSRIFVVNKEASSSDTHTCMLTANCEVLINVS